MQTDIALTKFKIVMHTKCARKHSGLALIFTGSYRYLTETQRETTLQRVVWSFKENLSGSKEDFAYHLEADAHGALKEFVRWVTNELFTDKKNKNNFVTKRFAMNTSMDENINVWK